MEGFEPPNLPPLATPLTAPKQDAFLGVVQYRQLPVFADFYSSSTPFDRRYILLCHINQ